MRMHDIYTYTNNILIIIPIPVYASPCLAASLFPDHHTYAHIQMHLTCAHPPILDMYTNVYNFIWRAIFKNISIHVFKFIEFWVLSIDSQTKSTGEFSGSHKKGR